MKAYKVEVLIIDHDAVGSQEIQDLMEEVRYPNHCLSPSVMNIKSVDIEWSDDHPLNLGDEMKEEYKRLFK